MDEVIKKYIDQFSEDDKEKLNEMYTFIHEAIPESSEKITWHMPTFYYEGNVVHFANGKHHIGYYPAPSAIEKFEKELTLYKTSKGAIQFPKDKKLPKGLIQRIAKFRLKETKALAELKKTKKK